MYVILVATELSLTGFNVKWLKIGGELGHTHFLRGPTYESLSPPPPALCFNSAWLACRSKSVCLHAADTCYCVPWPPLVLPSETCFPHCIYAVKPHCWLSWECLLVSSWFTFRVLITVSTFHPLQVETPQRLEEDFKLKRNFSRICTSIRPLLKPLQKTWTIEIEH